MAWGGLDFISVSQLETFSFFYFTGKGCLIMDLKTSVPGRICSIQAHQRGKHPPCCLRWAWFQPQYPPGRATSFSKISGQTPSCRKILQENEKYNILFSTTGGVLAGPGGPSTLGGGAPWDLHGGPASKGAQGVGVDFPAFQWTNRFFPCTGGASG